MRVLLDTNIIIHREASATINPDIGILFRWLDNLHYQKCIHPITLEEFSRLKDPKTLKSISIKIENYNVLPIQAPISKEVAEVSAQHDKNKNDLNDSKLLNELFSERVDFLITEDKNIFKKARYLGIAEKVFSIDSFLEKVSSENPALKDYTILSVRKDYFGNLNLSDEFFVSFLEDYSGFEKWFKKKAHEEVYTCRSDSKLLALLYLKLEKESENYQDIEPRFLPKKRLKIGTFKVSLNGYKLGERFLKIIFDNASIFKVDEIYVTIYNKRFEQKRLINLLEEFGFTFHGQKNNDELVFIRNYSPVANLSNPRLTYPFASCKGRIFLVPIYPDYHTSLFPDSILKTESAGDFVENEPYRNAISKVYISRSLERNISRGDILIFYRTGGYYQSVVTTLGIVEGIITKISSEQEFIKQCRKRSVFTDLELSKHWNYKPNHRPFIVNFLYAYSFPKRINLKRLIELQIIPDVGSAPRGFTEISTQKYLNIMKESESDESIAVN